MGFNGSNESSKQANEMVPRIQSISENTSTRSWSKDALRGHKAGLNQIDTEKSTVFLPGSEAKNFDMEKPVDYTEGLSEESDYMWLSSDKSSSLFSSDDSQDIWEFDCRDLSIHDRFSSSSLLSESYDFLSDKGKGFPNFDGFRMSPTGETPLVLNRQCEDTEGEGLKKEIVLQLHETVRNKVKHSQNGHSDSCDSSYEVSLSEDLPVTNNSCTSFNTYDDTPSRDFDRTDIWVSSLDLEEEDSELIQDTEQAFNIFDLDFPSPSFSAKLDFQIRPSSYSSISSIGQTDEVNNATGESDFDEPLFWPFDHNSYRCLEFKSFLCLSPRKDGGIDGVSGPRESKLVSLRLHQENTPAGRQVNKGCRRRLAFSPTPKSAATECKTRGSDNSVRKCAASPSGLSKATKASSDQHSCNISKKRRPPHLKNDVPKHANGQ
ncbi:uncharacterized protein LOC120112162 [Phoenix dactylifera]|uniref:Uncharacterized protein LOC120112162 n=1 Tax=Phoenix dactylifera TaxID=42345 RepID=A0A8B9ATV0_PHODC|nr:uncharacterized protein LOC120112162 [Phoenix dactylifera]